MATENLGDGWYITARRLGSNATETFEVDQTQYTTTGWAEQKIGVADFESAIKQAKKTCKELGFKEDSKKVSECIMELIEISDAYAVTKAQEKICIMQVKHCRIFARVFRIWHVCK